MKEKMPLHDRIFLVICNIFNFLDKDYLAERKAKKRDSNEQK